MIPHNILIGMSAYRFFRGVVTERRVEVGRKKKLGRRPEEQRPNPESRKNHRSDPGDGNLHMYTLGLPVCIPKSG